VSASALGSVSESIPIPKATPTPIVGNTCLVTPLRGVTHLLALCASSHLALMTAPKGWSGLSGGSAKRKQGADIEQLRR
jgi:hypothetical protein